MAMILKSGGSRGRNTSTAPSTPAALALRGTRRECLNGRSHGHDAASGQTLVEFALVLVVFMLMTLGLLDGVRVIFYYSQVQEAARAGARWGAVQVGRAQAGSSTQTVGGLFTDPGNAPGAYSFTRTGSTVNCWYTPAVGATTSCSMNNTIIGAIRLATTAMDITLATATISTTVDPANGGLGTVEISQVDPRLANKAVIVSVGYSFKPILGMVFGGVTINLQGKTTMLHE